jgi:hypothetical protein
MLSSGDKQIRLQGWSDRQPGRDERDKEGKRRGRNRVGWDGMVFVLHRAPQFMIDRMSGSWVSGKGDGCKKDLIGGITDISKPPRYLPSLPRIPRRPSKPMR